MKIVLFSSHHPGFVNKLNIYKLICAYPNYEFKYVMVDNRKSYLKNTIKNRLKEIVLFVLFKNTGWYKVRRQIEREISQVVPKKFDHKIERIYVKDVNSVNTENIIRELKPDLLIQCGAGILKNNIFSIPKLGTLNVHHGIAPEIRGISSTFWAMYYGLNEFIGTTVHFIDENLDTGAVIIQKKTMLPEDFDYLYASLETAFQGSTLLPEAIQIILGKYSTIKTKVESYYFSSVHYKQYWALEANKFKPAQNKIDLKFKIKSKNTLS